ncbi:MAG: alpha/beta fold hydrolase [Thermoplasmata archaeon]|nr:alpha/beta fold hydrolase [Thermoplasmata archaeon]
MKDEGPPPAPAGDIRRWLELPLAYSPSVAHDGESVYYLSDESGLPQPFVVPARGGTTRRVIDGSERVGTVHASPSGPEVMLSIDTGGDEHWQLSVLRRDASGGRERLTALTAEPKVIHAPGRWRPGGGRYVYAANSRDPRFFDIYEMNLASPEHPRRLLEGDALHAVEAVRDERVLVARANTNLDVDLLLLEDDRIVHVNPHAGEQSVFSAALGVDGVYAGANPDREFAALVRYRFGGQQHEFLREFDGDVELVRRQPSSETLLVLVNHDGWSQPHLYDPATGEDRVFNSGPKGVIASASWYPDGSAFAYEVSSVDGAGIYRRDIATGKEKRLAGITSTPAATPAPYLRSFPASDRVRIPYWELAPAGPSRGTLLWIHGGPESQARPGFSPVQQCLVARGWRVISPNIRGSSGYGRTYLHLDDVRLRMNSVRDVRELVDELVRLRKAERGRIGIIGGSYGGFVVLAAVTTYPDVWGAAVEIVGISNFVTFLERTGVWRRKLREFKYGSLDRDREFLESISPIHRADQIRAPLLVIHGRNDPRVPFHEAEQLVQTLRDLGRPVELLAFENEGHGIVRRDNRFVAWERTVRWFDEHLSGPA